MKLEALERQHNQKKIKYLEAETSIDEAWRDSCDDDGLAKQYIDEGLKFFNLEMFWGLEKPQRLQEAFADNATTQSQLMSLWIKNYPGSLLMLRCNIHPRNDRWMPQILAALESDGPPVAFIVGVVHLTGEKGLLVNLQKNGYKKMRRIFSISKD